MRVLLIEDDGSTAQSIELMLKSERFNVYTTDLGEEGIDLAILPIGDNFTMGPDDALRAVKLIQPKKVVPIHYNTWPLIAQDGKAWGDKVRHITTAEPIILQPGGWVEV